MPIRKNSRRRAGLRKVVQSVLDKNTETKTIVYDFNATSPSLTGTDYGLTDIAAGDTQQARDGNSVRVKSVFLRLAGFQADATQLVRAVVYIPKDPNHLMATDNPGVYAGIDLDRYHILYDSMQATSSAAPAVMRFEFKKRWGGAGLNVQWHATGSTNFTKNPIYLHLVSDSSISPHPALSGYSRVRFKDA